MSRLEQSKHSREASREERIYNLVEQTMAEFNRGEQLPPNPYLFTRVQAELQRAHAPRRTAAFALRMAALALLLAVNVVTARMFWTTYSGTTQTRIAVFAEEFGWQSSVDDPFTFESQD